MKHTYISLGSACDTAMVMDSAGVRKKGYPFDWLWNLDTGLESVTEIIRNDFKQITSDNCYAKKRHYRFSDSMIVYKDYPSIAHLHVNPLEDIKEHQKSCRRAFRFIEEMKRNTVKHFIYYRCLEEDLLQGKSDSINTTFNRLINEGETFVDMMTEKYPNIRKAFHLLLIIQVNENLLEQAKKIIETYTNKQFNQKYNKIIKTGYTITRNDEDKRLKSIWRLQWMNMLLKRTKVPFFYKFGIIPRVMLQHCQLFCINFLSVNSLKKKK